MNRAYYENNIQSFIEENTKSILGILSSSSRNDDSFLQKESWENEIQILKIQLKGLRGSIFLEFSIPRMGKRIDAVIILKGIIFILEFKIGEKVFTQNAIDQTWDYAIELNNFHKPSHKAIIIPILIATKSNRTKIDYPIVQTEGVVSPIKANSNQIRSVLDHFIQVTTKSINTQKWINGEYCPTPTIVEAAMALYRGHSVKDISRSDAGAKNLSRTSTHLSKIIKYSRANKRKSICFVTGVPGAGKTLVGLDIANKYLDPKDDLYSVYLSGNGPLVDILREALARDRVRMGKSRGKKMKIGNELSKVKLFIQNVHHFRDEYINKKRIPPERVVIFDEAQRAWNREQTIKFMSVKRSQHDFDMSEPEFLISCMDRRNQWAVIVCLVGGGQEINTGEAGISEWMNAVINRFKKWDVYLPGQLSDSEYRTESSINSLLKSERCHLNKDLHLSVSMRSFRTEKVSRFVKEVLDIEIKEAKKTYNEIKSRFPIKITRDLSLAKKWLKDNARGSERYGILASSNAERLKPYAIDVRYEIDYIKWFLADKTDVRSSYYLEDVATEFHVQGLELDWSCVTWDADLRFESNQWDYKRFKGNKWEQVRKNDKKQYLLNAYRVLLTRARQGMVIVVPPGDSEDPTRKREYYDPVYKYLTSLGIETL